MNHPQIFEPRAACDEAQHVHGAKRIFGATRNIELLERRSGLASKNCVDQAAGHLEELELEVL